jgi:hypothetical protein
MIKAIVFGAMMLAGTLAYGQKIEVMIVDQYLPQAKNAGLYVFKEGEEPQKVPLDNPDPIETSKTVEGVFAQFYKERWTMQTMAGDGVLWRYVFERVKM